MKKRDIKIEKGKLVVTEVVDTGDAAQIEEVRKQIEYELNSIVRQVKALKERAEELKAIREQLKQG